MLTCHLHRKHSVIYLMAFSIVYEISLLLFLREMEVAAHKSIVVKLKQQNEFLQEDNRRHEKVCKK